MSGVSERDPIRDLASLWTWFADESCRGYSPLYDRICRAVAGNRDLLARVREAPPDGHAPTVLLGAVHYLLLADRDAELAAVYDGRSDADAAQLFPAYCHDRWPELLELLRTRRTQTNECGRSAFIGPALTWLAARSPSPMALVDVGTSAGLSLRCDRYLLDYGNGGVTGPADSDVVIRCELRGGSPPIAARLPDLVARIGVDRSPVDVTDEDDARWLLACVWPDTGRLDRTRRAIALARENPVHVVKGEALAALPSVLDQLPPGATACVLTTAAFAYLSLDERARFVELLERASSSRPVGWISAEQSGVVGGFDVPDTDGDAAACVLGAVRFDTSGVHRTLLGVVHAHGQWIDWRD
ncbi:MAG TPA: DUF2332 domain-containing protein [Acidimicrobiales bacterium]|nr:DUF2332 domain-containing protein [Acidimicrobiales bacterium]